MQKRGRVLPVAVNFTKEQSKIFAQSLFANIAIKKKEKIPTIYSHTMIMIGHVRIATNNIAILTNLCVAQLKNAEIIFCASIAYKNAQNANNGYVVCTVRMFVGLKDV